MIACAKESVTVVRYNASLQGEWDTFVAGCKNFTFLFLRAYIDYNPRFTDHSLLFYKGGKLVGALPANINGDTLVSHGGLTYGGLLVGKGASIASVAEMFAALRRYLESETNVTKIVYRPVPHIYATYPAEEDLYMLFRSNARIAARRISSVVWQGEPLPFSTLRRRKVKLAEKAGFSIVCDNGYASFWEVLQENLQQVYGAQPVHSLGEMELLAARFPQNIKLYRVVDEAGATVAGTVLYITSRVARVQYIGSVTKGRENGALDLLFHHLVHKEWSHKDFFDFGTSVEEGGRYLNAGLIFQKEGFGGRAVVYDSYEFNINDIPND